MNVATSPSPLDLVEGQFDAYAVQDLDAFCRFFADDVVIAEYDSGVVSQGVEALRARYAKMFAEFPQNRAELAGRMVIGSRVIDHERIKRTPDGETLQVAVIYSILNSKIARMEFVR